MADRVGVCPACGAAALEPAGSSGGRAVCVRCGRCWEGAGRGAAVDSLACPGCDRRGTCEERPTWLAEELTRHEVLGDGTRVLLRPLLHGDRFELAAGYEQLSPHDRRLRFLAPVEALSEDDIEYLTNLDYRAHFAWGAFLEEGRWPRGVGVARYVRDAEDPGAAEVAVTVPARYQRRGLGTLLTRALADVAAANGVQRFVSYVRWDNDVVIDLLTGQGATITAAEPGIARIELALPAASELEDRFVHRVLHAFADGVRDLLARFDEARAVRAP
jgi:acetyltransferase